MQENINTEEVNKFNQQASRWWDEQGDFKSLHDINPLRLSFVQKHTELYDKKILDVGCGGGIFSEALAREGAQVTGLDAAPELIKVAKLHLIESQLDIDYQTGTLESFSSSHNAQFDCVTCMELLEHVPDPVSIINAASQCVKSGGHLFFSTLNRNIKSFLSAIIGAEYIFKLLPQGTHHYKDFIKPSELARWCRQANLEVKEITGLNYNPLTKRYYLKANANVNYLLHAIKK